MGKKGWILPEVVNPPDSYTVCICVPNDIHYISAFWGALQELAYQFNWERDPEHKALAVSVKWNEILAEANTRSNGEPLMCFSCTELTDCITPLLEAQSQQFQTMLNMSKYGTDRQPGQPMTNAQRNENLAEGTNPTCDEAIVCGQAKGIAKYFVDTVTAVLNAAEAATNTVEFLDVITSITGLDELSADTLTGYITFVQEAINENYIAQANTAYQDAVACAIYCRCKVDCEISAEDLYQVFRNRVENAIGSPLPAFNTLLDLFQFLYGVPMSGTIIADTMHLIVAGGGVLANTFLGEVGTKSLSLLLALAADEPSNDCGLLCDCGVEFSVPANSDPASNQYDTGLDLVSGADYQITATGTWSNGVSSYTADGDTGVTYPHYTSPTADAFSLIYRIGTSGAWTFAGTDLTFTAGSSGRLYLCMNDDPTAYGDNSGSLAVTVAAV